MLLSRDELIAALFRETDRSQRMKMGLAVILYAIDDWEAQRSRVGESALAEAEQEVATRVLRLLRCYDSVGRYGDGEFALVLPGCNSFQCNVNGRAAEERDIRIGCKSRLEGTAVYGMFWRCGKWGQIARGGAEECAACAR